MDGWMDVFTFNALSLCLSGEAIKHRINEAQQAGCSDIALGQKNCCKKYKPRQPCLIL